MKKRVLSLLTVAMALMMVFVILPATTYAASTNDFTIENGVLKKYNGAGGDVVIPEGVTSIGESAFLYCSNVTSITIPNSVTEIGAFAFCECRGLTSITIPDSVTSIGENAFQTCVNLTSVTIPDSVTSIKYDAFRYCISLSSVTIPDSVTYLGGWAFFGCSSLTSVTLSNSITCIDDSTFNECSGLTSITIPNSVTSIGETVFEDCTSLTSITIPNSVTAIGVDAFKGTPWLKSLGEFAVVNGILLAYQGTDTVVTIPNSVTSIVGAFKGCDKIISITIPDSVTDIGDSAFLGCSGLNSVTLPNSVIRIGVGAFCGTGLNSVIVPNSVSNIDDMAFAGCDELISLTIPTSVTEISSGAFFWSEAIKDIYYMGSEEQWDTIYDGYIDDLTDVTIHYNHIPIATATPTGNTLLVDGAEKLPAAYMINDNNYFKLRDVAALLNGTQAQFSIGWDGVTGAITITTGEAYTALGTELQGKPTDVATAQTSQSTIYINGQKADLTAYLINDNNYFKLRDLGKALGFNVSWDGVKGAVLIESNKPYSDAD